MPARRLFTADAEALRAVRLRAVREHQIDFAGSFEEEAAWPLDRWRQWTEEVVWVGVDGPESLEACAFLRIPALPKLTHNGWVHGMYVAPEARGAGAADAIMEAIEAEARARGVVVLKLLVRAGNAPAERFYVRRGFAPYGHEPASHCVEGVFYDSIEMAKALPRAAG